jgi:hypothetical protein
VDEQADGPTHGLPEEEAEVQDRPACSTRARTARKKARRSADGGVEVGNEGAEAVGPARTGRSAAKQANPERARKTAVDWNVQLMSLP